MFVLFFSTARAKRLSKRNITRQNTATKHKQMLFYRTTGDNFIRLRIICIAGFARIFFSFYFILLGLQSAHSIVRYPHNEWFMFVDLAVYHSFCNQVFPSTFLCCMQYALSFILLNFIAMLPPNRMKKKTANAQRKRENTKNWRKKEKKICMKRSANSKFHKYLNRFDVAV